jgi:hypothetical protein
MSASQVVLYFDKPEDAIQFTVAASSVLAADGSHPEALLKVAQEMNKVRRIRTEAGSAEPQDLRQDRCA